MPPSPSTRFAKRDRAILEHVSLYGIGLPAVVSRLFFGGKQSGHVLKRFSGESGPLESFPRALPGGLSYVRLSVRGASELSAPKDRAEPLGAASLDQAIGIAFFCCLGDNRRYRIDRKELLPIFGNETPPGNVVHILSVESGAEVIYRIYQAQGSIPHTIQRLREHIAQATLTPAIKPFLETGLYGMAVLSPTSEKLRPLTEAIRRHEIERQAPLLLGVGPTAATLAAELRRNRA